MRHILFIVALLTLSGCKTPTTTASAIKEKPIADPLFTSKKPVEGRGRFAGPLRGEELPVPQPPPALVEPPRPDPAIRLAVEK